MIQSKFANSNLPFQAKLEVGKRKETSYSIKLPYSPSLRRRIG